MILKAFRLIPGMGSDFRGHEDRLSHLGLNYTFIIGTRTKPTNRDRERIERSIAGAWAGIFDDAGGELKCYFGKKIFPPDYGVSVVPDSSHSTSETEPPRFLPANFYILFALLESDSALSEEEEREVSENLKRAIENQIRNSKLKPRIGIVTLYNCSVQLLEGQDNQ